MENTITVWRRSAVGELCWDAPGGPAGIPVVPLLRGETPCVALPLAHLDAVSSLPDRAVFCVTDAARGGEAALALSGRIEVLLDLDGSVFGEELIEQEVVKHPPTRLRAGSLMARKENWWWVPRAVVALVEIERVRELPARSRPEDALLVRAADGGVRVDVVTSPVWPDRPGQTVELWSRDGSALEGGGERALVFSHYASPDLERWERWDRAGTLTGEALALSSATGAPVASPAPFGLVERYRNHREVMRACKEGIAAAERRSGAA